MYYFTINAHTRVLDRKIHYYLNFDLIPQSGVIQVKEHCLVAKDRLENEVYLACFEYTS